MKRRRAEIAILAIGIAVLAALSVQRERVQRASVPSTYSTYDTGPNGYRALYAVLLAAGVPLQRFQRPLGSLGGDVRTLIVSSYLGEPSERWLGSKDTDALRRFVERGGRLVALDVSFAGKDDAIPGVGTSVPVTASGAVALARNRFTAGVTRVAAPVAAAFAFALPHGVPLLANARGLVAVRYRLGKGDVVAITAPAIFSNRWLRDGDNLAFAYDVVAGHGTAAFDEYVHGYDDELGFWQVLPQPFRAAFWIACAIVVLALIGANVPFAPPVPLAEGDDCDSAAYVTAMAALMRRARAGRTLLARFAADAARAVRGRDDPALHEALRELQRLRVASRLSDSGVVRAAVIAHHLRKETR